MEQRESIHILPAAQQIRTLPIKFTTYEYRPDGDDVIDIEIHQTLIADIPEIDFMCWLQLCLALQEYKIDYDHFYMKKVIPYDQERLHHNWSYFTKVKGNRLYRKDSYGYRTELLLYYIQDFDYYVMIHLKSHRGQLACKLSNVLTNNRAYFINVT